MWRPLILGFVICGMLAVSGNPLPLDAGASDLLGDADCSGSVNPVDALVILRENAGSGDAPCVELADVQCDGDVDPIDALQVLRFEAELSVNQEPECTPIGEPVGPQGPSSFELIETALEAGDIDGPTALVFTAYAVFGDSRLPDEFAGGGGGNSQSSLSALRTLYYDDLTEQKAVVDPFFLPPSAPGSWLELQATQGVASAQEITWTKHSAVGGNVKVWAQDRHDGDNAKAEAIAAALTAKIHPKLIGLMGPGHEPFTDLDLPNNGGDGATDIYLVHINDRGQAIPSDSENRCELFPDYLIIDSARPLGSETSAGILQTVTHEYFHAIQDTFDLATNCWAPEYRWFAEASAKWSEDFVYPDAKSEHPYAVNFLDIPGASLDVVGRKHEYGAYLYPFFLDRIEGEPELVRTIWENFANSMSLKAINDATTSLGGFKDLWPEFALYNWNSEPVDNYYQEDLLTTTAEALTGADSAESITLSGGAAKEYPLDGEVQYLAAHYFWYTVDPEVKTLVFENLSAGADPDAAVQALLMIDGQWRTETWTAETEKTFCFEEPEERVEQLVIIISNSDWNTKQKLQGDPPRLIAKPDGCQGWVGTMKATETWDVGDSTGNRKYGSTTTTFEGIWRTDLPGSENVHACHPSTEEPCYVHLAQGTIHWTWNAQWEGDVTCDAGTFGETPAGDYFLPHDQMFVVEPDGPDHYRYWGLGNWVLPPPQGCPEPINGNGQPFGFFDLSYNELPTALPGTGVPRCETVGWRIERTSDTIQGTCGYSFRIDDPGGHNYFSHIYEWELHRVGPAPEE